MPRSQCNDIKANMSTVHRRVVRKNEMRTEVVSGIRA